MLVAVPKVNGLMKRQDLVRATSELASILIHPSVRADKIMDKSTKTVGFEAEDQKYGNSG